MKQQVNLYQPIFRKQRIVFSAQTMLSVALGFLVLLVAYAVLINWRVTNLEAELQRQLRAEQRSVSQLGDLRESLPPAEPSAELVAEVERLEQRHAGLRQSVEMLRTRIPESRTRLRPHLEALARRHPDGLWLTHLEMADSGRLLQMQGRALSAGLVPAYIDALSREPAVSGLSFRQVRISAGDDAAAGVEFEISTRAGEPE